MLSRALIAAALIRLAVAQATTAQLVRDATRRVHQLTRAQATVDGQYVNSGFQTPIGALDDRLRRIAGIAFCAGSYERFERRLPERQATRWRSAFLSTCVPSDPVPE